MGDHRADSVTHPQSWALDIAPPVPLAETIQQNLAALHIPGASIAVIQKGEIAWASGFGYADLSEQRAVTKDIFFSSSIDHKDANFARHYKDRGSKTNFTRRGRQ